MGSDAANESQPVTPVVSVAKDREKFETSRSGGAHAVRLRLSKTAVDYLPVAARVIDVNTNPYHRYRPGSKWLLWMADRRADARAAISGERRLHLR